MKKFLITEEERKNILSQYKTILEQKKLDEQALQKDGTYKSKHKHQLIGVNNSKLRKYIRANTTFTLKGRNVYVGNYGIYLPCDFAGYKSIYIDGADDNTEYKENAEPGKEWLSKTLRKLFCEKKKEVKNKKGKKCAFVEIPFEEKNFCRIQGDNNCVYIKTDEKKWYTSKVGDQKTWCELTEAKFPGAIKILEEKCVQNEPVAQSKIDSNIQSQT